MGLQDNVLLFRNDCCVYNGTLAPVDTEVYHFSPDNGCTHVNIYLKSFLYSFLNLLNSCQVSMKCEMCPEGPCVWPHVEFNCLEYLTDGMQQLLDYFFYNYNTQYPSFPGLSNDFFTLPVTQPPNPGTEKPISKLFLLWLRSDSSDSPFSIETIFFLKFLKYFCSQELC